MQPLVAQIRDASDARSFWRAAQEGTRKRWSDVNRTTFDRHGAEPISHEFAALIRDLEEANQSFEMTLRRIYGGVS